jgi:hypothetical protein
LQDIRHGDISSIGRVNLGGPRALDEDLDEGKRWIASRLMKSSPIEIVAAAGAHRRMVAQVPVDCIVLEVPVDGGRIPWAGVFVEWDVWI